ncbi:MAG: hypothetical protein D6797_03215 [Bdellovibrio sp.]|nr:MAG: hypothetical protein D6797_03215 [Bdellovibrio sp.]
MKWLSFFLFFSYSFAGFSEYRVYQLQLTLPNGQTRNFLSTLDHIQYATYYPLPPQASLKLLDSWMCWERTNHLSDFCPNPQKSKAQLKPKKTPPSL